MKERKKICFRLWLAAIVVGLFFSGASPVHATYAKFDIPGDFPGNFRIDFLGTDFKMSAGSGGSLSTESTIGFSVGSGSSGVHDISVSPQSFQFIGFEALPGFNFDVYGAGSGSGTFDTNTGDWYLEMPTLFVNDDNGHATKLDMFFSTQNILIPASGSYYPAYWTTTATPMILDENNPNWGDLNLVAGGLVQAVEDLTLFYDEDLIANILAGYSDGFGGPALGVNNGSYLGIQYEFDIYGNDPLSVPEPSSVLLIATGLAGLVRLKRRRR